MLLIGAMLLRLLPFCALLALAACEQGSVTVAPPAPEDSRPRSSRSGSPAEIAAFYREARQPAALGHRHGPRPEALALAGEIAAPPTTASTRPLRRRRARRRARRRPIGRSRRPARAPSCSSRAPIRPSSATCASPPAGPGVTWVDAELAPEPPEARALLEAAAAAPDLGRHLAEETAVNPLYAALSRGYARRRAAGRVSDRGGGESDPGQSRPRPAHPGAPGRYVIVDAGSARLWMIDGDRVEGRCG
jgi:hypothetical protein